MMSNVQKPPQAQKQKQKQYNQSPGAIRRSIFTRSKNSPGWMSANFTTLDDDEDEGSVSLHIASNAPSTATPTASGQATPLPSKAQVVKGPTKRPSVTIYDAEAPQFDLALEAARHSDQCTTNNSSRSVEGSNRNDNSSPLRSSIKSSKSGKLSKKVSKAIASPTKSASVNKPSSVSSSLSLPIKKESSQSASNIVGSNTTKSSKRKSSKPKSSPNFSVNTTNEREEKGASSSEPNDSDSKASSHSVSPRKMRSTIKSGTKPIRSKSLSKSSTLSSSSLSSRKASASKGKSNETISSSTPRKHASVNNSVKHHPQSAPNTPTSRGSGSGNSTSKKQTLRCNVPQSPHSRKARLPPVTSERNSSIATQSTTDTPTTPTTTKHRRDKRSSSSLARRSRPSTQSPVKPLSDGALSSSSKATKLRLGSFLDKPPLSLSSSLSSSASLKDRFKKRNVEGNDSDDDAADTDDATQLETGSVGLNDERENYNTTEKTGLTNRHRLRVRSNDNNNNNDDDDDDVSRVSRSSLRSRSLPSRRAQRRTFKDHNTTTKSSISNTERNDADKSQRDVEEDDDKDYEGTIIDETGKDTHPLRRTSRRVPRPRSVTASSRSSGHADPTESVSSSSSSSTLLSSSTMLPRQSRSRSRSRSRVARSKSPGGLRDRIRRTRTIDESINNVLKDSDTSNIKGMENDIAGNRSKIERKDRTSSPATTSVLPKRSTSTSRRHRSSSPSGLRSAKARLRAAANT